MGADAYHCPPMFNTIPNVYCSAPSHPGGVQSGQRPGPFCFENSKRNVSLPSGVPVPLIVNGQFWPACVAAPSYVIGMVAPPSFPVIVPATLRFSGHDIVNWPTAIVAVWVVIVSCMFEHCERLAGNPSALMRRLDTQVPISDEVDAVGPDAVGLDAVTSAGRLVGP